MAVVVVEATTLTRRDGVRGRHLRIAWHHGPARPVRPNAAGLPEVRTALVNGATVQGTRTSAPTYVPAVANIGVETDEVCLGPSHLVLVILLTEGLGLHVA